MSAGVDDDCLIGNSSLTYSQVAKSQPSTGDESNLNFLSGEIVSLFRCDVSVLMTKFRNFVPVHRSQTEPTLKQIMIIDFLTQFV